MTSPSPVESFRSDNLLSNEVWLQYVIPELLSVARTGPGRVYMGVGPEQNFTYIAALKPSMAIIVDVRRGNLHMHLMYKALFDMSTDRADFVSRLFSRKRPEGLTAASNVRDIFQAFAGAPKDEKLFEENFKSIIDNLKTKHGFALDAGRRAGNSLHLRILRTVRARSDLLDVGGRRRPRRIPAIRRPTPT